MPVGAAPTCELMPRIEISVVPNASPVLWKLRPGTERAMSEISLIPCCSIWSPVSAEMLIGTLLMSSERCSAVTTTSSSWPRDGAAGAAASDGGGGGGGACCAAASNADPRTTDEARPRHRSDRDISSPILRPSVRRMAGIHWARSFTFESLPRRSRGESASSEARQPICRLNCTGATRYTGSADIGTPLFDYRTPCVLRAAPVLRTLRATCGFLPKRHSPRASEEKRTMPGRHFLFVPGPTNIPDRVIRAMAVAMEDHRNPTFGDFTLPIFEGLNEVFKTKAGQCFIFPASGTGGWEAGLTNTLSPGDRVLASRYGQFSHLWIDLAQRIGLDVQILEEEWGTGTHPEHVHAALEADKDHRIKGVMVVQNETATGVSCDVHAVRKAIDAARHPALLYVDGVSSIGSIDFRMDEWGVDIAVAGSQKGFMLPAGLALVCAGPKAFEAKKSAKCARVFFDFDDMTKANATGYFPYTPSLPLLYG